MSTAASQFAIDGCTPERIMFPTTIEELVQCARSAHAGNLAVIPVGNGTQLHVGRTPTRYDVALSTQRLNRMLAHEAADMTVTVEAGITLADLNAALVPAGQRLPLDPPHPERTTIGALIATDACGPLRLSHGKVRDLLIGITVVLADGTLAHGGGRVVKNVAGYDLMKLFTGSFGTLGIIAEATFKLRPVAAHEAVFALAASGTEAAVVLGLEVLSAQVAPHYIEAVNAAGAACVGLDGPAVVVGCGGSAEEIAAQRQHLEECVYRGRLRVCATVEAARLYAALRDFPAARTPPLPARPLGTSQDEGVYGCRFSVLPSQLAPLLAHIEEEAALRNLPAAILSHVGNGVAFLRVGASTADDMFASFAEWLQKSVRTVGGWAMFDLLPPALKGRIDPWGAEPPGIALMRGIKRTLDPSERLSRGRFVGGI
jgi:glycolate dehydrogenase FAD-binding subunit